MSLAETFAQVAADAMALDLAALRDTIRSTADDGLRAASYDGPAARSADRSSTTERQALNDRRDPSWDDLRLIDHHEQRFVDAIGELAVRSRSGRRAETWDDAIKDAHLLAEMDAVGVLERIEGEKPAKWVHAAGDALHDLELIVHRHMARKATDHERTWTSGLADEACCRVCLQLGLRIERKGHGLCQPCLRLKSDLATELDVDTTDAPDPPPELLEEFRRINSPGGPAWKALRSKWISAEVGKRRCA